ncbi:PREDICTED: uncharacterized protein LOC105143515 [Acromyrmex echinatior]|uniref:uncharacterized protein LOC105143515 n=1 Tax=Acromyrmex echinatior TaxID=103372 RepID=UPI000580BE6D|nr:PREDICTED: uncharacterized protein LOC105143515 [Acromyrmex echinatior]
MSMRSLSRSSEQSERRRTFVYRTLRDVELASNDSNVRVTARWDVIREKAISVATVPKTDTNVFVIRERVASPIFTVVCLVLDSQKYVDFDIETRENDFPEAYVERFVEGRRVCFNQFVAK